jgi:hypothetical protein
MSKDLTSRMHMKMKLYTHKLQEGGFVSTHLSVFKEIVADLQSMEVKYEMRTWVLFFGAHCLVLLQTS